MQNFFYNILTVVAAVAGDWIFLVFAGLVAIGYFLFVPRKTAECVRFYRLLFPEKSNWHHIVCTLKQYLNFTTVFLDRFLLQIRGNIRHTSEGLHLLQEAIKNGTGGILLMSHTGNWEIAAHLLKGKYSGLRLMLLMGIKHKEQIEAMQKQSLADSGIRILAAAPGGNSPFDIVEAVRFLRSGGFVSLTGDVVWHPSQKTLPVKFSGHEALVPELPHILALISGCPIYLFFSFKTGRNQYHMQMTGPFPVTASDRSYRKTAILHSARNYATHLESMVRQYPFQWYHFERFIGRKAH